MCSSSSSPTTTTIGYEFVSTQESEFSNPWKESFKLLYKSIHVRPGYRDEYTQNPNRYKGRRMEHFDLIEQAFNFVEDFDNALILIHSGIYKGEFLIIDTKITLLGAAPGGYDESRRQTEWTVFIRVTRSINFT